MFLPQRGVDGDEVGEIGPNGVVHTSPPLCPNGAMHASLPLCPNGAAYTSPGVQPWEPETNTPSVLKERRIDGDRAMVAPTTVCGVPSERGDGVAPNPRALPWAGMRTPLWGSRNVALILQPPPGMGKAAA